MSTALAKRKPGPNPLPRNKCIAEGCEAIADHPVSGLCGMHYARRKRNGHLDETKRSKGTGTKTWHGYIAIAVNGKKKQAHVIVAEKAIGKPLPLGAEVHHVNEDKSDNRPENLVICQDRAYHKLLHVRATAMAACGNPNFRKCPFCKTYGATEGMRHNKSSRYYYHLKCKQDYRFKRSETL